MRTSAPIRIVVHWPETGENERELTRQAANVHADFVLSAIRGLSCPTEQKRQLLRAVMETVRASAADTTKEKKQGPP